MPSKRNRSKAIESRFLFIAETPSSGQAAGFPFSTGRSKQSHVQRLYFERKKQAALGRASTEPPLGQSLSSPGENERRHDFHESGNIEASGLVKGLQDEADAREGAGELLKEPGSGRSVLQKRAPKADHSRDSNGLRLAKAKLASNGNNNSLPATIQRASSNTSLLRASTSNHRTGQRNSQETSRDPAMCFIPVVAGGYFDPFDSSVVIIDKWAHTLITYYMIVVIPSIFRADSQAIKAQLFNQSRHNSALFDDIQNSVSDKAHFYSLLTASASRMLRVEGKLLVPPNLPNIRVQGPEDFKALAVQALRSRLLGAQVDNLMVQDVYRLYAAEILVGNLEAAEIHFAALSRMVDTIGGVQNLTPYTMERVILTDIFSAVLRLCPPRFQLTWDPGPFPLCLNAKIHVISANTSLASFGQTLLKSAQSINLHPAIFATITDLIPLTHAHLVIWQESHCPGTSPLGCNSLSPHGPPLYNAEGMHVLLLRRTAIEHRLLSLPRLDNRIQEAFRLTLLLFIGMTFADPARRTVTGKLRSRLRETLTETGDFQSGELWWPQTGLLLWVCCIASLASEESGDGEGWECFGRVAARCWAAEELMDLESVNERLGGFFWLERMHGCALERLFERFDEWVREEEGQKVHMSGG